MSSKKIFTAEEVEALRINPYTASVTPSVIHFTLDFKKEFWRLSAEGCTGNQAFRKLGCDPDVLGFERVHNVTKRVRREGKSSEGIRALRKSRMKLTHEGFSNAELEKMSRRESEQRMQNEIVYLQQQMAFLKKLMRQPSDEE